MNTPKDGNTREDPPTKDFRIYENRVTSMRILCVFGEIQCVFIGLLGLMMFVIIIRRSSNINKYNNLQYI